MLAIKDEITESISPSQLRNVQFAVMEAGDIVQRRGDNLILVNSYDGWKGGCGSGDSAVSFKVRPLLPGTVLEVQEG